MSDTVKLNLRQKLVQIYSKLDHVEKAGFNKKQGYKFVRAADMLRAMRAAFAELGIYAETNYELLGTYDIKTNSGGTMHTATVKATIVIYDTESDETKTISGLGDGADSGDKGIFKAQTGATKNALRNGSLLPDEADPEADESVDAAVDGTNEYQQAAEEPPDFQDARHAAPRANEARPTRPSAPAPAEASSKREATQDRVAPATAETTIGATTPTAEVPSKQAEPAQIADSEKGDAYEGPDDDGTMPTEAELTKYRQFFVSLSNDLSTTGKLKPSQNLPLTRKILVFFLHTTKAEDAKTVTKAQWENFFVRVEKAKALESGLVGLAKYINKINGVEEKTKQK